MPFIPGIFYTKQEVKNITLKYDDQINKVSDKYSFKNYIKIAMSINISLQDWMSLTPYAKTALIYDHNEIIEEQEAEVRKKESEQKEALKEQMRSKSKTKIGSDTSRLSIWR